MAPDLSILANYPIIQFIVGAAIVAVMMYAWVRGQRDKEAIPPPPEPDIFGAEHRIRLEGPLVEALRSLGRMAVALEKCQDFDEKLSEWRRAMYARIEEERKHAAAERDKLEFRIRATEIDIARLQPRQGGM